MNRHVTLVAGRELQEAFRSRSYWITMAVLLVAVAAGTTVPRLFDDGTSYDLGLAGSPPAGIDGDLRSLAEVFDIELAIVHLADRAEAVEVVDGDDADAVLVFDDAGPTLVRRAGTSDTLVALAGQATVSASVRAGLGDAGLDPATARAILAIAPPTELTVDDDQPGRSSAAYVLSLLLYFALLMGGMGVAQGVAVEKSSRIAEVLVATVRPAHLLAGKVLGVGLSTLLLLLSAAVPLSVAVAVGAIDLPAVAALDILGGIGWFLLGYAIYATGFAALGALVDRQEDLGAATGPAMVPLVLAYFASFQAQSAPESLLARITSLFPLSSPIVMPVRMAEGVVDPPEIVAAVVLGLLAFLVMVRVAGAVYQRALLRGGRRLSVRQALRG